MRRRIIPYNPKLTERARQLRTEATAAERVLWERLKGRQVRGYDFHRQRPIGNYIVDFYCCELFLAIEVDGDSHNGRFDHDMIRQESLELWRLSFLRFSNAEVLYKTDHVIAAITDWIDEHEAEIRDAPPI